MFSLYFIERWTIFLKRIFLLSARFPHKGQLLYAVLVIILIPVIIVLNTFWALRSFERDIDLLARRNATITLDVLNALRLPEMQSLEEMQIVLNNILRENAAILSVTYLQQDPVSKTLSVLVDTDDVVSQSDKVLTITQWALTGTQSYIALTQNPRTHSPSWTITALSKSTVDGSPVVIVVRTDAAESVALLKRTSFDSLVILGIALVIVFLLLVNHFRFFDYARLYTKLKEVDQMKDDFLSTASHELRTPLTAIRGYAQMAYKNMDDHEKLEHDLKVIEVSANRLGDMVADMLDVSRIEQGRITLDMQNIQLVEVVKEVIDELSVQAQEKGLLLEHVTPEKDLHILADRNKLKQVLINIIGNALKYTLKGSVTVSYSIGAKDVSVRVKDTGLGMTSEDRARLFTKFYRIQTEETQKIPGTGLGLWITKQIVELMKGSLSVESMKGVGSEFAITFPLNS